MKYSPMKKNIDTRFLLLIAILSIVGIWRFISTSTDSSVANLSPLGAMALFAGTYFHSKPRALITPLVILFVSDLLIMQIIYPEFSEGLLYSGWYWTYGSFMLIVLIGERLKGGSIFKSIFLGGMLAGISHFIITNFGVWIGGGTNVVTGLPYTKDFAGLIQSYANALPFFRNFLLGNFIFGGLLFGIFELSQKKFSALQEEKISA